MKKLLILWTQYKKYCFFLIIALAAGFLAFCSWDTAKSIHILDFSTTEQADNNTVICSQSLALEKGDYLFEIFYTNADDPALMNEYLIYSPTATSENGASGNIFASGSLPPKEHSLTIALTLDSDTTNLKVELCNQTGTLEIQKINYSKAEKYNDPFIFYGLGLLLFAISFLLLKILCKRYDTQDVTITFVYLCLLIFVTMLPYMNDFLAQGHDLEFHLARIEGTYRGLKNGQFPVRINELQSNGYGYASPIMYPQLFLYLPAFFRLLGLSLMNAYKLLLLFINCAAVICSYFSFSRLLGKRHTALIATTCYVLSLYRLSNIYVRAAIGEALAMAFLPLILYGIFEIIAGNYKKWGWLALGVTCIYQSHVLSTEIAVFLLAAICLVNFHHFVKEPRRILAGIKAAIVTLLVNLWSLIPFLDYMDQDFMVFQLKVDSLSHATVYLSQLFATFVPADGHNRAAGTTQGEMPLTIGGGLVLGAVLFIYLTWKHKKMIAADKELSWWRYLGNLSLAVSGIVILMISWLFPWDYFLQFELIQTIVSSLQYTWRLLLITSIGLSLVTACAAGILIRIYPARRNMITIASCIIILLSAGYLIDDMIQADTIKNKAIVASINTSDELYLYEGYTSREVFLARGDRITYSEDVAADITTYKKDGTQLTFHIDITSAAPASYIDIPLYYYPEYQAFIDGSPMEVTIGDGGVIRLLIPEGSTGGQITVSYIEPLLWKIGNIISLITVLLLAAGALSGRFHIRPDLLFRKIFLKSRKPGSLPVTEIDMH